MTSILPTGLSRGRPSGKFVQVTRLERLRSLMLARGGGTTLQEIAEVLQVTPRTARRYLQRFQQEFELEQVSSPSRSRHWRVKSIERPRKIGLRRAQCYALLATRRLFEPMRGSALFDEFEDAIHSLTTLANRPGRGPNAGLVDTNVEDRFVHLPAQPANYRTRIEDVDVFYHAVADLHPVECRLRTHETQEQLVTLLPYAIVLYQDDIFIIAAESQHETEEARVYALDDLRAANLLSTERFALPKGFHLKPYYQGRFGLFLSSRKTRIVVDFDASVASQLRRRQIHPSQRLSNLRSGGLRMTLYVDNLDVVARWVLGFGPHARVIEPEPLRQQVIHELKATLSLYRERSGKNPA
ncbi:MAG TPA: WYL domain-containing protein [Polyangiaceae bacterium]|nr:WYL domain-containing protein [Polyangiaceae bacterium]HNZ24045.1 WYL domain-containing protein [Polyangiaceae bacterium]HOD21836.1 WYL domain-containing protein [Polyangiaceae bacterium]HOE49902.1 WYL domain-containing protein [Polyangiaceae bacterium]HOH01910.1 WYL domain-containing protein [Polyangiaceae bacterium]